MQAHFYSALRSQVQNIINEPCSAPTLSPKMLVKEFYIMTQYHESMEQVLHGRDRGFYWQCVKIFFIIPRILTGMAGTVHNN